MMPSLSRRISWVLGLAVVTVAGALFLEYFLSAKGDRPFGHTQMAHLVGWTGLGFIGLTFVYPLKRWMYPNQVWPQRWFHVHIVFGIVGPLVIFCPCRGAFSCLGADHRPYGDGSGGDEWDHRTGLALSGVSNIV